MAKKGVLRTKLKPVKHEEQQPVVDDTPTIDEMHMFEGTPVVKQTPIVEPALHVQEEQLGVEDLKAKSQIGIKIPSPRPPTS